MIKSRTRSSEQQVKSYFEKHAHDSAYRKTARFYSEISTKIKRNYESTDRLRILDVGCGDGSFIKALIETGLDADYYGIDISFSMLKMYDGDKHCYPNLLIADAFNMPFRSTSKFDVIHIDSVLHHLIASTRSKSVQLAKQMIVGLACMLANKGLLIIEEVYYDSIFNTSITSHVIFYGLKLLNFLHLDLSRVIGEIKPGLEVSFLTNKELIGITKNIGPSDAVIKNEFNISRFKKIILAFFLLSDAGHITRIVRK